MLEFPRLDLAPHFPERTVLLAIPPRSVGPLQKSNITAALT
jgi:hypothetical protein